MEAYCRWPMVIRLSWTSGSQFIGSHSFRKDASNPNQPGQPVLSWTINTSCVIAWCISCYRESPPREARALVNYSAGDRALAFAESLSPYVCKRYATSLLGTRDQRAFRHSDLEYFYDIVLQCTETRWHNTSPRHWNNVRLGPMRNQCHAFILLAEHN